MKMLILLRHAKSSWSDPDLDDHDRPLNDRGRAAAPIIAAWLAREGRLPDRIVCSSAKRARQTVKRMREAVAELPKPEIEPGLYHADPEAMLEILTRQPDESDRLMFVGHQPGLSAFLRSLVNGRVRPGCSRAFEHFPTAAAAVVELPAGSWRGVEPRTGTFVAFAMPRELADRGADGAEGVSAPGSG